MFPGKQNSVEQKMICHDVKIKIKYDGIYLLLFIKLYVLLINVQ